MAFDMREYARRGAESTADRLTKELEEIYTAFPDLRRNGRRAPIAVVAATPETIRRRRKPMSAAAKKAVGLRMKKYWAERKKQQAKA